MRSLRSSYTLPVLSFVSRTHLATLHQIIYRHWIYAGKGPSYGFDLLRTLEADGLVLTERLDEPRRREMVTLTDDGYHRAGLAAPSRSRRITLHNRRTFQLQLAEVLLEREADGWRKLPGKDPDVADRFREWALASFRGRPLSGIERKVRASIRRSGGLRFPVDVLVPPDERAPRLMVPIRRGRSVSTVLESLPWRNLAGFPTLHVEWICADLSKLADAGKTLERWSKRHGLKVRAHRVDHFLSRPSPREADDKSRSRYERAGLETPPGAG